MSVSWKVLRDVLLENVIAGFLCAGCFEGMDVCLLDVFVRSVGEQDDCFKVIGVRNIIMPIVYVQNICSEFI